jgi:hypothetical protein
MWSVAEKPSSFLIPPGFHNVDEKNEGTSISCRRTEPAAKDRKEEGCSWLKSQRKRGSGVAECLPNLVFKEVIPIV